MLSRDVRQAEEWYTAIISTGNSFGVEREADQPLYVRQQWVTQKRAPSRGTFRGKTEVSDVEAQYMVTGELQFSH